MFTILLVNQWQTWVIVLLVVLLLFGATRLPALSKSLGQSIKVFRKEVKDGQEDPKSEGQTKTEDPSKVSDSDKA